MDLAASAEPRRQSGISQPSIECNKLQIHFNQHRVAPPATAGEGLDGRAQASPFSIPCSSTADREVGVVPGFKE